MNIQLKHKFGETFKSATPCIYCGKLYVNLYFALNGQQSDRYHLFRNFSDKIIYINKIFPCLTKEEYLIKSIIE